MGKGIKRVLFVAAICLFSILMPRGIMAKDTTAISQVDVYLPDMYVYVQGDLNTEGLSARMAETDTSLYVKSAQDGNENSRGIYYHILLDTSDSVSEQQLEDMKAAIISLADSLGDADRMKVITFSNKVKVILKGGESPDQVRETLGKVKKGNKTHLFTGINALSDSIEEKREKILSGQDELVRNVGVILTDWQEVKKAGGETSREESLRKYIKTGAPLFGFCLKSSKVSLQDDMGAFLRETGGHFYLFDEEKKDQLVKLSDKLKGQKLLTLLGSSNRTYEEPKTLELIEGEKVIKKDHVYLNTSKADHEKPYITEVKQEGKNAKVLLVTFNEDVLRADNKNNYNIVKNNKKNYTVSEATYTSDSEVFQARLILNDSLSKGDYEVSVVNVTDNTNEENELTDSWTGPLKGEGALKAFYDWLGQYWIALLLVAVLLIIFAIYRYIKKHKGIMVVEDEMVLGDNLGKKQHVKNNKDNQKNIVLLISGIASETRKMETMINGSAIIGRSSICDIYFDDLTMSRQHFVLEVEQGEVYVTDLDSTSGTWLDGKELKERTKLRNGSEIRAGSVIFVVRW